MRTTRVFAILMLIWWVLDGTQSLITGVIAAALATVVYRLLRTAQTHRVRLRAIPPFTVYFLGASVRGGLDVARRAFDPKLPIRPHLFDHHTTLPAGHPRVLLISVTSLLPGTLSADISEDGTVIRIHAINEDPAASVKELEQHIANIFGEPGASQ